MNKLLLFLSRVLKLILRQKGATHYFYTKKNNQSYSKKSRINRLPRRGPFQL